jgi:hypothetical protein
VSLTGAVEPGIYRVELPDDLAAAYADYTLQRDGKAYVPVSVKLSPEESRLAPLADDAEAVAAKHLDYFRAANTEQMVAAVIGDVPGHELWKYLAVAAVVVMLAESFVTRWIALHRKQGSARTVDFITESERLSTFQQRARALLETVRSH